MEIIAELWVCVDCLMYGANRDTSGIEDYRDRDRVIEAFSALSAKYKHNVCCVSDEDTDVDFSSSPCDCCHSHLAGSRHKFVALA